MSKSMRSPHPVDAVRQLDRVDPESTQRILDDPLAGLEVGQEPADEPGLAPQGRGGAVEHGLAQDQRVRTGPGRFEKTRDVAGVVLAVGVDLQAVREAELGREPEPVLDRSSLSAVPGASENPGEPIPGQGLDRDATGVGAPVVHDDHVGEVGAYPVHDLPDGPWVVERGHQAADPELAHGTLAIEPNTRVPEAQGPAPPSMSNVTAGLDASRWSRSSRRSPGLTGRLNLSRSTCRGAPSSGQIRSICRRTRPSSWTTAGRTGSPSKCPRKYRRSGGTRKLSTRTSGPVAGRRTLLERLHRPRRGTLVVPEQLEEALVNELAGLLAREGVQDPDPAWHGDRVEPPGECRSQPGRGDPIGGHGHPDLLAAGTAGGANDRRGIPHSGLTEEELLDLPEGNPLAGDLRDAISPAQEVEAAPGGRRDQVRTEIGLGSQGKERRREQDPTIVRSRDRYPGKRTPRLRAALPGDPAGLRRAVDLHDPPSDSHPECLGRAGGKGSAGREHALEGRGVVHLGERREVGGHAHEVGGCVSAQGCNDRLRMEGRLADDDTPGPERQEDTEEETVDVVWRGSCQDSSPTRHAEDASEHGRLAQELNAGLGTTLAASRCFPRSAG